MSELQLASDLYIPLDAVTQTFAILAKRGSGKTYTALVIVEEMLKAGLQVVVVDPVGVCWGLRTSADGKEAGLPIIVLGGEHGDLVIEPTIGAAIADFVIQERQSVVLDLSGLSNNEMVRLVTDFSERLYQKNRTPLHIVLDEADSFAPQKPLPGEQKMLGAIDKIVRRGRAKGLGVSLVSQRPAVINKNVLTQIEVLIALRTVSPQDRKAIENWIEVHGTPQQREQLLSSLASLPVGTAWVWSPGWLNIFQCVKIRARKTFDSSATPKIGTTTDQPKVLAKVNLALLQQRFTAITAQALTQNRVSERNVDKLGELQRLQQLVINLENQLQQKVTAQPIFQDGEVERLEGAIHSLKEVGNQIIMLAQDLNSALNRATQSKTNMSMTKSRQGKSIVTPVVHGGAECTAAFLPESNSGRVGGFPQDHTGSSNSPFSKERIQGKILSASEQRILDALAAFESLGLNEIHRSNVAVFANQSPKSSAFTNNLSCLRSQNLICYPSGGRIALTEHGRTYVKSIIPIDTLTQLHQAWYEKLSRSQAKIVQALVQRYPSAVDRYTLAELVGQSATSSAYTNNLSTLRALGLIDYPRPKQVVVTKLLFPLSITVQDTSGFSSQSLLVLP